jgi:uncharacterized protein (DUF2252 family)
MTDAGACADTAASKPRLEVDQRVSIGKAARRAVPRSSHAAWTPPSARPDPVMLLRSQEESRVASLVQLRHERMLESPFAFYRGAAIIMASDLAGTLDSGLWVQCCGDAHLANFGGFAAPDRMLVFDMNDFDETNPGPFEWDVKRLATSFEIAARSRGFSTDTARSLALRCVRSYREAMAGFAHATNLDVWYARLDVNGLLERWRRQTSRQERERFERMVTRAQSKDSTKALTKLARKVDGEFRIVSDPPLIVSLEEVAREEHVELDSPQLRAWLHDQFDAYRRALPSDRRHLLESYRLVDFARKVVGVGSVGTRCWIALLIGRDDADPLFLQIKEADESVLERHTAESQYATHGQRVVEGQRLLQAASDILLSWTSTTALDGVDRAFYVRQLWDWKISADLETITAKALKLYSEVCGWTLARGHARSGDRIAISAYLGSSPAFDEAIADFATAYADQNQRDYETTDQTLGTATRR